MSARGQGYPIVSQTTLTAYMNRYLATAAGQNAAMQFVQAYFDAHPVSVTATPADVAAAVTAYFVANPPQVPVPSTAALTAAINGAIAANPDFTLTPAELTQAITAYFVANPVDTVTDAEIAAAVAAYMAVNNMKGPKGDKGDKGDPGAAGSSGAVLVGTATISQTAAVAISAGIRAINVTVSGVVTGANYLLFPTAALPTGYALHGAVPTAANTLQITLSAPLLAIGASYSIQCRVVRIVT
jgi:hypothetical protein